MLLKRWDEKSNCNHLNSYSTCYSFCVISFFTIDAGHYVGKDGLITLLEKKGFTITRVQFNQCDSWDPRERMINQRCYEPYVVK